MRRVQTLLNWILLSTGRTDLKRLERERESLHSKRIVALPVFQLFRSAPFCINVCAPDLNY